MRVPLLSSMFALIPLFLRKFRLWVNVPAGYVGIRCWHHGIRYKNGVQCPPVPSGKRNWIWPFFETIEKVCSAQQTQNTKLLRTNTLDKFVVEVVGVLEFEIIDPHVAKFGVNDFELEFHRAWPPVVTAYFQSHNFETFDSKSARKTIRKKINKQLANYGIRAIRFSFDSLSVNTIGQLALTRELHALKGTEALRAIGVDISRGVSDGLAAALLSTGATIPLFEDRADVPIDDLPSNVLPLHPDEQDEGAASA